MKKKEFSKSAIVAAIVVVAIFAVSYFLFSGSSHKAVAGVGSSVRLGEVCYGQDTDTILACQGAFAGTLSATNHIAQGSWQNTTGRNLYVRTDFDFIGSASSTFWIYVATSTTATIGAYQIPANPFISVIASTGTPTFAWSSFFQAAQATTSQIQNVNGVAPLGYSTSTKAVSAKQFLQKGEGVGGQGWVFVRPLEYIVFQVVDQGQAQIGPCMPTKNLNAGLCENATSTNRGFDINYRGFYDWTSTTTAP